MCLRCVGRPHSQQSSPEIILHRCVARRQPYACNLQVPTMWLPENTISVKVYPCCTACITLDDANDGWQGHVPKGMHADDLEGLPSRAEGHGHRPHCHRICA